MLDANTLANTIKLDFPVEPVPAAIGISTEAADVNSFFKDRKWTSLTTKVITAEGHGDVPAYLAFMTPAGFRYYLPAYMMMTLQEWNEDNRWLLESLPTRLMPENVFWKRECSNQKRSALPPDNNFTDKFSPFTFAQKRDIANFLYHQSFHDGPFPILANGRNDDAFRAFESYWYQFATPPVD
jgi:hypothetical protein